MEQLEVCGRERPVTSVECKAKLDASWVLLDPLRPNWLVPSALDRPQERGKMGKVRTWPWGMSAGQLQIKPRLT